jgi:Protein of unknown function (DUF3455)
MAVKSHWMAIIVLASLVGPLVGHTASPAKEADDAPAPLRVAAGEVLIQRVHAAGVQIYRCSADKADAARFEWQFQAPEADLFDRAGRKIGKHYAGPTWEANDGSRVTGEVVARADSPDPNSVPWLLLRAKSSAGDGMFGSVLFIQRLRTAGGKAPTTGCDQSSAGNEARTPYTAEYRFYAAATP